MTDTCPVNRPAGRSASSTAALPLLSPSVVTDPYPVYEQLREQGPVVAVPEHDLWLVTSYAACLEVLGDPERFSAHESLSGRNLFRDHPDAAQLLRGGPGYPRVRTLILTDPPEHTRYRRVVQQAFAPAQTVRRLRPQIEQIVDELIDGFAARGRCDFIAEFAYPLPMQVISLVLGIPHELRDTLKRWSDDFIAAQAGNIDADRVLRAARSTVEFEHYICGLLEERAAAADLPERVDFLSRLIVSDRGSARPLTRQEQLSLVQQMLVGGNETTTNLLGNAFSVLAADPDLVTRLRAAPERIPAFVEEVLRHRSPLQGLYRVTTRATTVHGVPLPAGAKLMVLFGSANRDESVYTPAGFAADRDNRSCPHLAFGRGVHACMGQSLARAEAVIAMTRLLARLGDIRLAGTTPVELFGFHGYRTLDVEFRRIRGQRRQEAHR